MPDKETAESIANVESASETVLKPKSVSSTKLDLIKRSLNFDKVGKTKKVKIVGGVTAAGLVIFGLLYFFGNKGGGIFRSPLGEGGGTLSAGQRVINPLTGELLSEKQAASWSGVRPLAIMVNNHTDARPQSGLIYADLVYEIVAEAGITRLVPFYLSTIPEKIGPVRSVREYYLVLVKELGDAMLMHIGWSPQALEAIETWPVRSLGRGGGEFWRDNPRNVATEHTAYVNGKELIKKGLELGWGGTRDFQIWQFKDEKSGYNSSPSTSHISIDFWYKGDYSANFDYDASTNEYLRSIGYDANDKPIPQVDQETGERVKVKNLIVQFVKESSILDDEKGRLSYELIGSGKGLVFVDGKVIDATWSKESRDDRTLFYDTNGQEIKFNRGKFWISVVPDRNVDQVVYN